jgi:hypothetical protein
MGIESRKRKMVHCNRGEPRWEGSAAEARLKKDMDEGIHLKLLPSEMRKNTPEYQDYLPKTFSSHIDQETRARKFQAYLRDKNQKKLEKLGK